MRPWQQIVPADQRHVYEKAGFHAQQPFGRRPVLLVVDVVLSFTGSERRPVLAAIDEFASSCGDAAWDALPRIQELIAGARAAGIPVVYTKGSPENKFHCSDTTKTEKSRETIERIYNAPIHPDIAPREGEWVLEKTKASAFFATPLPTYLNHVGADCVLVCGTSTSGCVRATALDAWNYGLPTFVVEECCFDRSDFFHNVTLYDLNAKYANVIQLPEALGYLAHVSAAHVSATHVSAAHGAQP